MTSFGNNASKRALFSVVAAAAVLVALHVGLLSPRARQTEKLKARALSLALEQAEMARGTQEVTDWLRLHGTSGDADLSGDSASAGSAVPALLQKLSELGEKHGVQVMAIRPDPPGAPITVAPGDGSTRTYARIPVRLSARASFMRLGAFLEDLDRQGGLAVVRSVHLSIDREHKSLGVELVIDAFERLS